MSNNNGDVNDTKLMYIGCRLQIRCKTKNALQDLVTQLTFPRSQTDVRSPARLACNL